MNKETAVEIIAKFFCQINPNESGTAIDVVRYWVLYLIAMECQPVVVSAERMIELTAGRVPASTVRRTLNKLVKEGTLARVGKGYTDSQVARMLDAS